MPRSERRTEGSIETLPSGRLRVRVYAGLDPLTKKPRYLREVVDTEKQAKADRARMLSQVYDRRHPRSDITVSEAVAQWLEVTEHEASTRERNEQLIRLYIEPTLGKLQLAKVDAEILERLYARLLKCRALCSGTKQRGHTCEPLAANTVRKVHFIIRATFERAVRWKYLAVNEAAMAEPPALVRSAADPPTAAEAAALLNEASTDGEWALLLWLTMLAGWRRGELCALRWTDVNLDCGLITIERSHWGREEKSTKSSQGRTIAVDEYTIGLLAAHRAGASRTARLDTTLDPDAFGFSSAPDRRTPLLPRSVSQRYRRLALRVGLRSTGLHSLRHYSATELIAARVDLRTVAGRLGHGSGGATTLKVYAAWSSDADRIAADTIAGIVSRPDPTKRQLRNPYEKIAHELRTAILAGDIDPGAKLPTVVELAAAHAVSPGTVNRVGGIQLTGL